MKALYLSLIKHLYSRQDVSLQNVMLGGPT